MEPEKLIELAKKVANSRKEFADADVAKDEMWKQLLETDAGMAYDSSIEHLTFCAEGVSKAEEELKEAVLAFHRETGDRKPIEKVEVKIFKHLEYKKDEILNWCKQNAPALLIVDEKSFKKTAEKMGAPIQIIEEPKCTLAKDMTIYLEPTPAEPAEEVKEEKIR